MIKEVGKKAPAFKLKDKDAQLHSLNDLTEDNVVIFFYPKDSTPGCTIESKEFSDYDKKFSNISTKIIGISGGNEKSKEKFCSKHKLKALMLSDSNFNVATKYGVYGEKKFMGKTYMGINRVTFVLDSNKKIIKVYEKVKPLGHAKEVYEFVSSQVSK